MKLNQNHVDQILQNIKSGQIEKGLLLTNSLLKTNKNSLHLNKLAAYIYGLKDKHRLSIQILNDIKNNFPEDFDISNNLGHAYLHEEKIDLAIENINKAIKINPESPAPYKNLAEVYLILRDFDKADTAINSCIEKTEKVSQDFQEFINVILIKIQILLAQKQKTLAINLITKYLENGYENWKVAWEKRCVHMGKEIKVISNNQNDYEIGVFTGINEKGKMMLKTKNELKIISSGECSIKGIY